MDAGGEIHVSGGFLLFLMVASLSIISMIIFACGDYPSSKRGRDQAGFYSGGGGCGVDGGGGGGEGAGGGCGGGGCGGGGCGGGS